MTVSGVINVPRRRKQEQLPGLCIPKVPSPFGKKPSRRRQTDRRSRLTNPSVAAPAVAAQPANGAPASSKQRYEQLELDLRMPAWFGRSKRVH